MLRLDKFYLKYEGLALCLMPVDQGCSVRTKGQYTIARPVGNLTISGSASANNNVLCLESLARPAMDRRVCVLLSVSNWEQSAIWQSRERVQLKCLTYGHKKTSPES